MVKEKEDDRERSGELDRENKGTVANCSQLPPSYIA